MDDMDTGLTTGLLLAADQDSTKAWERDRQDRIELAYVHFGFLQILPILMFLPFYLMFGGSTGDVVSAIAVTALNISFFEWMKRWVIKDLRARTPPAELTVPTEPKVKDGGDVADPLRFQEELEEALGAPAGCLCKKGAENTCKMCDCPRRRHLGLPLGNER